MNAAIRDKRKALRGQTAKAVRCLSAAGVHWGEWAEERGFSRQAVKDVVRDHRPATRGELARVALRIRIEAMHASYGSEHDATIDECLELLRDYRETEIEELERGDCPDALRALAIGRLQKLRRSIDALEALGYAREHSSDPIGWPDSNREELSVAELDELSSPERMRPVVIKGAEEAADA